jgi:4-hydroxy-3-polyprenylbenzoate decarboxylase
MPFNDIREFIERLRETGDLLEINREVDWNLEAGAIMRRCNETNERAQLFNNIKGYPEGYRLFGSPLANLRRVAIALEMSPESSYTEILDEYIKRRNNIIKPIIVSDGPCKENIYKGEEVDLFKFPSPMIHAGDGGRYIGTLDVGVCKDPDSDWINWGTYRLMIHDRDSIGIFLIPAQHVGMIYSKYKSSNKPMEYVAFMGCEPITNLVATTGIPYGVSEVDVIGAVRREPLKVVKCETVDLFVPASAEIVIEGEILPHVRKDEGPFGEGAGYQVTGRVPRPVFKVKAITHRNAPILPVSCIGVPVDDSHVASNIGFISGIKIALVEAGIPITGIYMPPESGLSLCIVSTKTPTPNIARRIASCVWGDKNGQYLPKIVVVDEDIDPTNMAQVIHAFATKCHPSRGIMIMDNVFNSPILGYLSKEERTLSSGSNVLFDCTWPKSWKTEDIPPKSSFDNIYPDEVREMVISNWKEYGF